MHLLWGELLAIKFWPQHAFGWLSSPLALRLCWRLCCSDMKWLKAPLIMKQCFSIHMASEVSAACWRVHAVLLHSGGHGIITVVPVMRFPCLFWQTLQQMLECFGLFLIKANSYACLSWWSAEQWPIYASFCFLSLHEQKQGPVKCCNIENDISMQRWFHSACTKFTGTLKSSEAWKS